MIHVQHIHRKPFDGCYSIESVFKTIADELQATCQLESITLPEFSQGIQARLANIRWARQQSADIFHVVGDVHYMTLGLPAKNTVLTIHDCEMLHRTRGLRRRLLKLFWFTLPCRNLAAITVVSQATKTELLRHIKIPEEKIHVIPNPVDTKRFAWKAKKFNKTKPSILQIGTRHNKNVERLIEALASIKCELSIVGPLTSVQRALLRKYSIDHLSIPNATDEQIVELYQQADIVSFASLHEGFGLPIVEAQSIGRPVVTSNCSSMPEVAGNGALLVDPNSTESIRDAIHQVIEEPALRQDLIEKGQENCRRFTPHVIAAQYLSVYQKLATSA